MTSTGRAENRQVEVAQFSRGLKLLAKDLDVPVLVAAQINRNVDQRGGRLPVLVARALTAPAGEEGVEVADDLLGIDGDVALGRVQVEVPEELGPDMDR